MVTASTNIDINGLIDHTYLKATCTPEDIEVLCQEALRYRFHSICIPPYFVFQARNILGPNSAVKICTVVGYPMGYSTVAAKVEEIKRAALDGADELDVVINLAAIKAGDWNYIKNDIESTTTMCHLKGRKIKIVFESSELDAGEVKKLVEICEKHRVDYIKASIGLINQTTTLEQIQYLRRIIGPSIKLKVEGKFKTKEEIGLLVAAGVNRIGTTSSIRLISNH